MQRNRAMRYVSQKLVTWLRLYKKIPLKHAV